MTIKGSLQVSVTIVKAFWTWNFKSTIKICPKITSFGENWGQNVKCVYKTESVQNIIFFVEYITVLHSAYPLGVPAVVEVASVLLWTTAPYKYINYLLIYLLTCYWIGSVAESESSTVDEGEAQIQIGRMIPLLQVFLSFIFYLRNLQFVFAISCVEFRSYLLS